MGLSRDQSEKTAGSTISDDRHPDSVSPGPGSPLILLLVTLGSVLVSEIATYFLVEYFIPPFGFSYAIADALTTTLFVFPVVYFLVIRRIRAQMQQLQELETSLRRSEADYRGIVEDQTELITKVIPGGKIVFANGAFSRQFGLPLEKIIGRSIASFFTPEDAEKIAGQISGTNPSHPILAGEYRLVMPDGSERWFSWVIHALYTENGDLIHYQTVGRDITEYKRVLAELEQTRDGLEVKVGQRTAEMAKINRELRTEIATRLAAEKALRASQSHVQQLIGQIPAILWTVDGALSLTDLFGSPTDGIQPQFEEFLERSLALPVSAGGEETPIQRAHRQALQGKRSDIELSVTGRDYHCVIEPFRDAAGKLTGCLGIALDITAQRQNEGIIRLQSTALEAAAEGIMITDRSGVIRWCNPALTAMTGYATSEIVGRTPALFTSGRQSREYYADLWNTITSGRVWRGELINRRKDGALYVEEQTITPVLGKDGRISDFIAIKHEITARKTAEEKVARRNWELQALNTIGAAISGSLDLQRLFALVKQLLHKELSIASGAIYAYAPEQNLLLLETSWGATGGLPGREMFPSTDQQRAILEKRPIVAPGASQADLIYIPLLSQGSVQGVMDLYLSGSKIRSEESFDFLGSLGSQIGVAIHNARLYRAEQRARRLAEILREASLALTQSLDLGIVIRAMLDSLERLVPEANRVTLYIGENDQLRAAATGGNEAEAILTAQEILKIKEYPLIRETLETREARVIGDTATEPGWQPLPGAADTRSWLGIPILVAGQALGLCSLESRFPDVFTPHHLAMTEALSGEAAIAIQNVQLYQAIRDNRAKLQALSRRLVEVQEMERRYIARELHDETSQALVGLIFSLEILKRDSGDPQAVAANVAELEKIIGEILHDLHRLAVDLRPTALEHLGVVPAIRQYVDGIRERYGLAINLRAPELPGRMAPDVETTLFRIFQEALSNVVRHAKATQVDVQLSLEGRKIHGLIVDNGIGFDVDDALTQERLGLFGMRERAAMMGGQLTIDSCPGQGTRVYLEVPCDFTNSDRR